MTNFLFHDASIRKILINFVVKIFILVFLLIIFFAYRYYDNTKQSLQSLNAEVMKKETDVSKIEQKNQYSKQLQENLKEYYDKITNNLFEIITADGTKEYYNFLTKKIIRKIDIQNNIWEYHPKTSRLDKKIIFSPENDTKEVHIYETHNGQVIQKIIYKNDDITEQHKINPETGKKIKSFFYKKDKIYCVLSYDLVTGDVIEQKFSDYTLTFAPRSHSVIREIKNLKSNL